MLGIAQVCSVQVCSAQVCSAQVCSVQVCSVLYQKEVEHVRPMLGEVESWMERRGFSSVDQFRGKLSRSASESPAAYERVQFMKATAGIE